MSKATTTRRAQLLLAFKTVTRRTSPLRRKNLQRIAAKELDRASKFPAWDAAVLYYLKLGIVPRSLWDN